MRRAQSLVVPVLLLSAHVGRVVGQEDLPNGQRASSPRVATELVTNADRPDSLGLSRNETIERLKAIAKSRKVGDTLAGASVAALVAIGSSREEIQGSLLDVITNDTTTMEAHQAACKYLVYVADDATKGIMFERMKSQLLVLSRHWSGYFDFFREADYPPFGQWLRENLEFERFVPVPREYIEEQLRYVELRGDASKIIASLEGGGTNVDSSWLVRHALKAGVPPDQVRKTVLSVLARLESNRNALAWLARAVVTVDSLIGFGEQDEPHLVHIRALIQSDRDAVETVDPRWARDRIKELRASFYGVR